MSAQQTDKSGSQEMTLHPTWMAPCLETTASTPFHLDQTPRSSSGTLLHVAPSVGGAPHMASSVATLQSLLFSQVSLLPIKCSKMIIT